MPMMLFAALMMAQAPAMAQPAQPAAAQAKKATEKKICRAQDAESGSHMSKRVCHTAREWELVDDGVNLGDKQIQTSLPSEHL